MNQIPGNPNYVPLEITSSTLPSNTTLDREWVVWKLTNREWIMRWEEDSSSWTPHYCMGDCTVYVSTSGTDGEGYGDGAGASAYATLQYAWENTPLYGDGVITFVVAAGTYTITSSYTFDFKHNYMGIVIRGEYTEDLTGTPSAHVTGHAGTITHTGGGLVASAHQNKIIGINLASGEYLQTIRSNTTTVFTVSNVPSMSNGVTTYSIYSPGTIFDGNGTLYTLSFNGYVLIQSCHFDDVKITQPSRSSLALSGCTHTGTAPYSVMVFGNVYSRLYIWAGIFYIAGNSGNIGIYANKCDVYISSSIFDSTSGTKLGKGVTSQYNSSCYISNSLVDNWNVGFEAAIGSTMYSTTNSVTNNATGQNVNANATYYSTTITYSGNTADTASSTSGVLV